jgi:hypothetical protein
LPLIVPVVQSFTVTVKLHEAGLPAASLTLQVTVVVPTENAEPDAGVQVGVSVPSQLSLAVAEKVTAAVQLPASLHRVMFCGQPICGASQSLTVTVKLHEAVLFGFAPVAVQVTVVVPFGNTEPGVGLQATLGVPSQLSVAVGTL